MLEIDKYFLDTMRNDSGLSVLIGADVSDDRMYSWDYPSVIEFNDSYKAAIFYKDNQNPRPEMHSYPSQRGNIYYYFSVVSRDKSLTKEVAEYIINMFENCGVFNTENWRIGNIIMNGNSEGSNEGTPTNPLHKRNISFLLKEVFKRNS